MLPSFYDTLSSCHRHLLRSTLRHPLSAQQDMIVVAGGALLHAEAVLTSSVCGAGLSREEQMWLAQRINDHLYEQTGVKPPELPEPKSFRSRPMQVGSGASLYGGSVWDRGSVMDSPGFWDDSLDNDD